MQIQNRGAVTSDSLGQYKWTKKEASPRTPNKPQAPMESMYMSGWNWQTASQPVLILHCNSSVNLLVSNKAFDKS